MIRVTSLDNSGPGSLRAALEAEGPRTVLFEVGGIIDLNSPLRLENPYITIAGESAPPPGITIRGEEFMVRASQVIIRHLRFRPGDFLPDDQVDWGAQDAFSIRTDNPGDKPISDIILDHCSFSWGTDEVVGIWHNASGITIQNSIISEGLHFNPNNPESTGQGLLIGSNATDISILRTFFINNYNRNPYMNANGHLDFRNNVIYNGGRRIIRLFSDNTGEQTVNLAHNLILEGPESRYNHEIFVRRTSQTRLYNGRIFLDGNRTSRSPEASKDNWLMVVDEESGLPFEDDIRSDTPLGAPNTTTRMADTLLELLDEVGAIQPARDPTDRRLADELQRGEGGHISHPGQAFGWSAQDATHRPVEELFSDWEEVTGVDLSDPKQQIRRTEDGYSELERFLHELANRKAPPEGNGAAGTMTSMGGPGAESDEEPGIQNSYPNPFREQIRVRIRVPEPDTYQLEVFNSSGRRVQTLAHRWLPEGEYDMQWDPGRVASGVYLIRLSSSRHQWIRKVVRVR